MTARTQSHMPRHKPLASILTTIVVLLATAAYVAMMQMRYGAAPLYGYDEAWHLFLATIGPSWKTFLAASGDSHPPGYYLIMRQFFKVGQDPLFARLPTILATIITVPVFFALLRKVRVRPPVALASVVVLAVSFPFLTLGVTARQYSVTVLILLVAMWFWVKLLPGSKGRPSRWSAVFSLLLFSLAFTTMYASLLVTAALFGSLLISMAVNSDTRRDSLALWRRYSGWPEWLLFTVIHLAVLGWYIVGWARHIDFNVPSHVASFTWLPGQPLFEFLLRGLRLEVELFTPLTGLGSTLLDIGLAVFAIASLWVALINLRNGKSARAALALSPLLLTAILALTGVLGKYPFGGNLRHQYILFPLLVVLLALSLDSVWRRLASSWLRAGLLLGVVGIAILSSQQTLQQAGQLGEAPASDPWAPAYQELFKTARDEPLLIPSFAIYLTYANRYRSGMYYHNAYSNETDTHRYYTAYQGWLAIAMLWAPYEEFVVTTDDGGELTVLKDHYRWLYPPVPDELFFTQTRGVLKAIGKDRVRVFALQTDPNIKQDPDGLKAAAAANGFTVTEYLPLDNGAIWTIALASGAPQQSPADVAPAPQVMPATTSPEPATTSAASSP